MNQQNKKNISLIMIIKNEINNLNKNLDWVNNCKNIKEIILIDDESTDNLSENVKKIINDDKEFKIFKKKLNNNFSKQRNFAISKTKYDWVLYIDADEQPSNKLIEFIDNIDNNQYENYSFKRQDFFLEKELKHGENIKLDFIRLFNKNHGKFIGKVHEIWKSSKITKKTNFIIYHYPHKDIKSLIQKINLYSTIRAQEMFEKGIKTNILQIIFFPMGKFIQNYFFRLGFLDSTPGIIMALSMSLHVFLNKAKLWHLYQK